MKMPNIEEKKKKKDVEAVVNIYTSFNNTIVHVTDMSGKTISKVTGGMVTKHGRLKANPTIAMFTAKRIAENIKDLGVESLYVRIRAKTRNPAPGPGTGRCPPRTARCRRWRRGLGPACSRPAPAPGTAS